MRAAALLVLSAFAALVAADDLPWWKSSVLYQIYPRSFADSDGDGNGDLNGILKHVDYLKELGVGIVWLSPIYDSPMKDQGYDVSDFKKVNPLFGTLDDAKALIKAFHDKEIKFFMDFVPNHSSNKHPWFEASRHRNETYSDFYVWRDPSRMLNNKPVPPNNWISAFNPETNTPAWTYDYVRRQFYLHMFGDYQPDLNYNNPKVIDAMFENMDFWLELGVDGFRMDAVPYLAEDRDFRDEPTKPGCKTGDCLDHIYTENTPQTYQILQELENRITSKYNSTKYMFYEVYANQAQTMKYYYKNSSPFNFVLIQDLKETTNATTLKKLVDDYMKGLDNNWPNWVIGNHDQSRVGTRLGSDFIDAANMLVLLLPGTSTTFQGEEIGMTDLHLQPNRVIDCCGRDPQRTPFQWDDSDDAGFSLNSTHNATWLPVNPNYKDVNVKSESGKNGSHLETYKRLVELRKQLVANTDITTVAQGDWVFIFSRTNGESVFYIIINLNNVETEVTLKDLKDTFKSLPDKLVVHTPSANANFAVGDKIDTSSKITLRPRSGLVASGAAGLLSSVLLLLTALATLAARYH